MAGPEKRIFKLVNSGDVDALRALALSETGAAQISGCRQPNTGDSVAHVAARRGDVELLALFIESGVLHVDTSNLDGKRPLHDAAQFGHAVCANYLLRAGAEVDSLKRADWTPLMLACTQSSPEVVDVLLQHGADPHLRNKDGWNSFHIACREGHPSVMRRILAASPTAWDTRSNNARTPLHTIALHGHVAALEVLLSSCHFDLNVRDSCGSTPFVDAAKGGFTDMIDVLMRMEQVDVMARDTMGRLAIHAAAECGHVAAVRTLVATCGMGVDEPMLSTGSRCLHLAAKEGHDAVISTLVELGANVELGDSLGRTALHIARSCRRFSCVEVLLEAGSH